jgi:predicted aldo/keto reductase-like oxidoreductase
MSTGKVILKDRYRTNQYEIKEEEEKRKMANTELKRLRAENKDIKELFELQGWVWNEVVEDNVTRVYRARWDCQLVQLTAA